MVLVKTAGVKVELTGPPQAPSRSRSYFCQVPCPGPWLRLLAVCRRLPSYVSHPDLFRHPPVTTTYWCLGPGSLCLEAKLCSIPCSLSISPFVLQEPPTCLPPVLAPGGLLYSSPSLGLSNLSKVQLWLRHSPFNGRPYLPVTARG